MKFKRNQYNGFFFVDIIFKIIVLLYYASNTMEGRCYMDFFFDNDRPIYIQLVEQLRMFVISSSIKKGERLPSVRELALIAKVNPNTMQKALSELEDEKLIYTERTNGKFVTNDEKLINKIRTNMAKEKTNSFFSDMKKIGMSKEDTIKYLHEIIK